MKRTVGILGLMLIVTVGAMAAQQTVPVMGNWDGKFVSSDWQGKRIV